jgi:type I restriction enzyme M protein
MIQDYNQTVRQLIDDLKATCVNYGLGGEASEYKIVTQMFLYKFLNDKFLYAVKEKRLNIKNYHELSNLSESDYDMLLIEIGDAAAEMKPQHLLEYLFSQQDTPDFAKTFDEALNDIAIQNNAVYSVHTDGNTEIRLFDEILIRSSVADRSKHNAFAKDIINKLANSKFNFDKIFSAGFDFFSTLFEYMIKDYNKDGGGKYAEYYTPHSVAKIMAEILVGNNSPKNVKVYDPSAGSGTLLMNIASKIGTDRCMVYSQDISQKSSNLLRLNLILNGLAASINNIVQGNTILHDRHNKKMDFIVSNPPFKLDFSDWRNDVETLPNSTDRFFAGAPNIPNKDKDKMAIYLLFIQHIIYSLSPTGKAAVVVPTGFITAQSGIEMKIRRRLVDNHWLKGVVSMPSNIFATTGTNVSILFIDKGMGNTKPVLIDASKLGTKIKDGKNQKTLLSAEDEQQIISVMNNQTAISDFSVSLDSEAIKAKNYSLAAGQYFEIKIEYSQMNEIEFDEKIKTARNQLSAHFAKSKQLETEILSQLTHLKYEK